MNLPLFMPGMQNFIVICIAVFAGAALAIYLLKYKFKHPFIRKVLTIFVLVIAGLVTAYVLFYTISNAVGRFHVEARLAEMRLQRIPLDRNSVFPKTPENASDNGVYFYKAAFELINASPSYKTLCAIQEKQQTSNIAEWPERAQNIASQLLKNKDIEQILSLFCQGAAKPYAVYEHDYFEEDINIPEIAPQQSLFRLICMKSSLDGLNGNPEAGYNLILAGFSTIKQLESNSFIFSQLVYMGCVSRSIDAMNSLIFRYGISSQSAEQLLFELDKFDFKTRMSNATNTEIVIQREFFEKFIYKRYKLYDLDEVIIMGMPKLLIAIWPFFYQDYAYYLEQQVQVRTLYFGQYWLMEKELKELSDISCYYPISKMLLPYMPNVRLNVARTESCIDAAKLTLALHIFKNKFGSFPHELRVLAPDILKQIPVDPISGKPFEYHKTDGTFTLSSVWLKEKAGEDKKEQEKRNRNKSK